MTDTKLLNMAIRQAETTREELASKLEMSLYSLWKRINNKVEFKQSEIQNTCDALCLTREQKESIFFAQFVDLK